MFQHGTFSRADAKIGGFQFSFEATTFCFLATFRAVASHKFWTYFRCHWLRNPDRLPLVCMSLLTVIRWSQKIFAAAAKLGSRLELDTLHAKNVLQSICSWKNVLYSPIPLLYSFLFFHGLEVDKVKRYFCEDSFSAWNMGLS